MPAAHDTILVVDDDADFRAFVSELLARAGFDVEEAGDVDDALDEAAAHRPDLVLLDVKLPRVSGYELLRELRDRFGESLPVIFVSGDRTDTYDRTAGLLLGADDYVVKPFDPSELVARIRRSLRGNGNARANGAGDSRLDSLTDREREVLVLLARGKTSAEIAQELVISPRTLGTHVQHVLTKLDVRSRTQAVALAHRAGLVDDVVGHAVGHAA